MKQVILGRSNLHTFFALFNNIVPLALTTVNYVPWLTLLHYLPWLLWLMCPTTGPIDAQVRVQLSQENGVVTMGNKLNPSWSHVYWCTFAPTSEI
jgi:hypothetical protein